MSDKKITDAPMIPSPPRVMVHIRHRANDDKDRAGRALIEVTLDGRVYQFRTKGGNPPLMVSTTELTPEVTFDRLWHEYGETADRDYRVPTFTENQ